MNATYVAELVKICACKFVFTLKCPPMAESDKGNGFARSVQTEKLAFVKIALSEQTKTLILLLANFITECCRRFQRLA